jgi:hypothetical protein
MCYVHKVVVSVFIIGLLKCCKCVNSHVNNRPSFYVIKSHLLPFVFCEPCDLSASCNGRHIT